MFEWLFWSSAVDSVAKLPKETLVVGAAALVIVDIHRRNTNVKIAEANARVRVAEANLEAERLKAQQNSPNLKTV